VAIHSRRSSKGKGSSLELMIIASSQFSVLSSQFAVAGDDSWVNLKDCIGAVTGFPQRLKPD
jgi:hypothetical protein